MNTQFSKKWAVLIVCCIAIMGLLIACQPKAAPTPTQAPVAAEPTPDIIQQEIARLTKLEITKPDFSQKQVLNPEAKMNPPDALIGSGVFPDNYYTSDILHTGARGCMSCHADLYGLVKNLSPTLHVASMPTYGKSDDVKYCTVCHDLAIPTTGGKLGNLIHDPHLTSDLFTIGYKGTCWSCHALDNDGNMVLFDTVKYDAWFAGGFLDPNGPDTIWWQKARGFPTGFMTGFDMVEDFNLDIVK